MAYQPIHDIRDHGAHGADQGVDTGAIQAAIDAAHAQGGGAVRVPPGRWRTGTIVIRSGVTVDLCAGATLLGSPRLEDWRPLDYGQEPFAQRHLVVFHEAREARLVGQGTVDGQGQHFWDAPDAEHGWIRAREPRPGPMVCVARSRHVELSGVLLTNGPNWTSDIYGSEHVRLDRLRIINDPRTPNNDGVDISGSSDVTITGCWIETGDDAIVINGRCGESRRIVVGDCHLSTDCAAVKVGWEFTRHDIGQIAVANCVVHRANRAVAFYTCNGATLEDVAVANLVVDTNAECYFARPIHMDLRRGRDAGTFGAIRNIVISGMTVRTPGRILITAEEGGWIEDVTLRDIRLAYPFLEDPEPWADGNRSSQFSNPCRDARRARAAVVIEGARRLAIEGLAIRWPDAPVPARWRLPVKRENGGTRLFRPDYDRPRPCAFAARWTRRVEDLRWNAPDARDSEA